MPLLLSSRCFAFRPCHALAFPFPCLALCSTLAPCHLTLGLALGLTLAPCPLSVARPACFPAVPCPACSPCFTLSCGLCLLCYCVGSLGVLRLGLDSAHCASGSAPCMPVVRKQKSLRINGFAAVRFVYEITYDLCTSHFPSTPKNTISQS